MDVAALIAWIVTALGGAVLLFTWLTHGGTGRGSSSGLPPAGVFLHFLLAATGLVLWIIYLVGDSSGVAWTAFGILVVVALVGFTLFFRWLKTRSGPGAESRLPVPVVYGHGLLGATTLVLVFLAAANAG